MQAAEWTMYGSALIIAFVVPGPDMMLVLQTGAAQGRRSAFAVAVGLALARAVHVALAGLGLAALLQAAPTLFGGVRLAGCAYLVWVGLTILRAPPPGLASGTASRHRIGHSAVRGMLTNLLNPKALLFCSVLLPQFIRPEEGFVAEQFLLLGTVLIAVGFAFDSLFTLTGAGLGEYLRHHPVAWTVQRWGFATLLIGFAAELAVTSSL